jgi:hypothetical protein
MFIKEYRFSCAHYTYVLRSKSSGSRAPHTLAFSSCSLSNVSWNPTCFADVFVMFQRFHSKTRRVIWTFFVAQCWTLWITRNKFTLEAKFPRKPANIIFKTLLLLQQWRVLRKPEMLPLLDEIIALLKDLYSKTASRQDNRQTWRPSVGVVSLPILLWTYSLACGLLSQNFVLRACSVNLKLVSQHVTIRPWGFINLKLLKCISELPSPFHQFGLLVALASAWSLTKARPISYLWSKKMFIKEYRSSCAHYTYVLRSKSSGSRAPHALAFSSCSLSYVISLITLSVNLLVLSVKPGSHSFSPKELPCQ